MVLKWSQVVEKEEFKSLPDAEKEAARQEYFNSVVAPNVPQEEIESVREQFDRDTSNLSSVDEPHGFITGFENALKASPDTFGEGLKAIGGMSGIKSVSGLGDYAKSLAGKDATPPLALKDIDGITKAGQWLAEQAGQGVGSSLPMMLSGVAGGVGGTALGTRLGGPKAGAIAGTVGTFAGASAPATLMNIGDLRSQLIQEGIPEEKANDLSVKYGLLLTIPDVYSGGSIIKAFGKETADKMVIKPLVKRIVSEFKEGAIREASTEAIQQAAQEAVVAHAAGKDMLTPETAESVFSAAVAGGLSGGLMQGPAGIRGQQPQNQPPAAPPTPPPAAPAQPPQTPVEAVFQRAQQQGDSIQGAPLDTGNLSELIDSQIAQQENSLATAPVPPVVQDSIQTLENLSKGQGPKSATLAAADPSPATVIPPPKLDQQAPQGVYNIPEIGAASSTAPMTEATRLAPVEAQAAAPSVQTTNVAPPAATTAQQPLPPSPSYVIVNKQTGEGVFETFERKTAEAINRDKYDVIPIKQYLVDMNQRIKEAGSVQPLPRSDQLSLSTEQTAAGEQTVLPGAERISDKQLAERRMAGPSKAKVTQKAADDGLFDVGARSQTDLMDLAAQSASGAQTPSVSDITEKQSQKQDTRPVMIGTGDVLYSQTGRRLSPFPKINAVSNRTTSNTAARVEEWLLNEAKNEADARGDDFNKTIFSGYYLRNLSQSDKDSLNEYLFGNYLGATEANKRQPKPPSDTTTREGQHRDVVTQIMRERGTPMLDLNRKPTGWVQHEIMDKGAPTGNIALIHPSENIRHEFTSGYPRAGAEAQAFAIDNPVTQGATPEEQGIKVVDLTKSRKGQKKPAQKKPLTLLQFIAKNGGINDSDIADIGKVFVPGYGRIASKSTKAKSADAMTGLAWDAGYFGMPDMVDRPTPVELSDLVERSVSGQKIYSEYDRSAVNELYDSAQDDRAAIEADRQDMLETAENYGIDIKGKTDEQIIAAINAASETNAAIDSAIGDTTPTEEQSIEDYYASFKNDLNEILGGEYEQNPEIDKSLAEAIQNEPRQEAPEPVEGEARSRAQGRDEGNQAKRGSKAGAKEAGPVKQQTTSLLKKHQENIDRLYDGEMTADEARAAFKEISENEQAIKDELNKKSMKELSPRNLLRLTKPKLVNSIYKDMLSDYIVKAFSWSPFEQTHEAAVAAALDRQTDADIKEVAGKRKERIEETRQALEDPKTLADFSTYMRIRRVTEANLPAELKARYDELIAQRNKDSRARDAEKKSIVKAVDVGDVGMEIVETKHTQKGHDLFVVKLSDKLPVDKYRELVSRARQLDGYYSSYRRDGAIPGFQFKTREEAEKFVALKEGDISKADTVAAKKEEAKLTAAQRLSQMADEIDAKADEAMNRDRLTNTAKRARQAGYADDEARAQKALAQTMRNIASAMEDGKVKHLDGIRSKAAIETLESLLKRAHYDVVRQKMNETGDQYEKLNAAPITQDEVDKTTYPYPHAHRDNVKDVAEAVKDRSGFKRLATQAIKDAEEARRRDIWQIEAKTLADQERLIELAKEAKKIKKEEYAAERILKSFDDYKRLKTMGLTDLPSLRAALREYLQYRGKKAEKDRVKELERGLVGQKVGIDFFPTPKPLAERMAEIAGIGEGAKVLEPSAGNGNIADALRETGATVDVAEISKSLRDVLEAKGYPIVSHDFMDVTDGGYDAIVMNPPFSNNQDIEHVRHAYSLVKDGGKVVAIVGEGAFFRQGKTEQAFRDWLDEIGADVEKLPDNTFQDKKLLNTTGANARLVTITKGDEAPLSLAQNTKQPIFYSQLQRSIESLSQAKGSPEQWRGIIKNLTQKGVKQEETDWSGVEEWLSSQNSPVTRQEILDYLRANDLQIKEVVKGGASRRDLEMRRNPENQLLYDVIDGSGSVVKANLSQSAAGEFIDNYHNGSGETKFANWQLGGDKAGYRELLLTLPERSDGRSFEKWLSDTGRNLSDYKPEEIPILRDQFAKESIRDSRDNYRSSHFEEPNIVAHIRFNERTDADGKRVLFIEEIQSDWHQAGRKGGYKDPKAVEEMKRLGVEEKDLADKMRAIKNKSESRSMTADERIEFQRLQALAIKNMNAIIDLNNKGGVSGVPDAPFKTTWPELAFKRALRYAAENGFDRVAWTTGEQQADRYDLSKSVETVEWFRNKDGSYDLIINTKGAGADTIDFKNKTPSEIEDVIGKEATKKIEESAGEEFEGRLAGELSNMDLKVGGEGMKGFYDKILPATVNKLVKKWGGKAGETHIPVDAETGRYVYDGPIPTLDQVREVKLISEGRGEEKTSPITGKKMEYSLTRVAVMQPMRKIVKAMEGGASFNEAISAEGTPEIANIFGGTAEWEIKKENKTVHSLDITPAMRESVMQGLALFQNKNNRPSSTSEYVSDLRTFERFSKEEGKREDIHETIRDYLVGRGKDTGNEYAVVYDAKNNKVVDALTNNNQNEIPDFGFVANSAVQNGVNSIVIHHNHPNIGKITFPLSRQDLWTLGGLGIKGVIAHHHDGGMSGASLTPAARASLLKHSQAKTGRSRQSIIDDAYSAAKTRISNGLLTMVFKRELSGADADKIINHMVNWSLDDAGIINYNTTQDYPDIRESLKGKIEALISEAAADANKRFNEGRKDAENAPKIKGENGDIRLQYQPVFYKDGVAKVTQENERIPSATKGAGVLQRRAEQVDTRGPEMDQGPKGTGVRLAQNRQPSLDVGQDRAKVTGPKQPRLNLVGGEGGSNASWDAPEATALDSFIQKVQNRLIDLKRAQEAIAEVVGTIKDSINPYVQEELYHGRVAKRVQDFTEIELKGLTDYMAANGIEMKELEEYLHALHAPEANKLIAERNPEIEDGGSGMTDAEAAKVISSKSTEEKAALDGAAKLVRDIINKTNQAYVDYGLLSKREVDSWNDMFKNYIPLMREDDGVMGVGRGFSVRGKEVKHRTGSTKAVINVLGNIALQREKVITRGEKNRVSLALAGLVAMNPNPSFWSFGKLPTEPRYNEATGLVEQKPIQAFKDSPNIISVKVKDKNGEVTERAIVFNRDNPRALRLAMAMKNLDIGDMEGFWNVSGQITRYFSSINTAYNPAFGPVNLFRDVQSAAINLSNTELASEAKDILNPARVGRIVKEIYRHERALRKGKNLVLSEEAKMWVELQDEGGMTGFRDIYKTSGDRSKAIQRQLKPNNWKNSSISKVIDKNGNLTKPIEAVEKAAGWMGEWLTDYNQTLEAATRVSVYMAARKKGLSKTRSASLAKNATVNFNRRGAWGSQIGSLYAFFNASVQGTARMAETLFTMKGGKAKTLRLSPVGKKIVAGGMLLGAMQAVVSAFAFDDDDDPPQFVRERNLLIPLSNGHYATLPMPLGYNLIVNMGRIPMEWMLNGGKDTAESVTNLLGVMADTYNPIGSSSSLGQTLAPTIADPFVAISENKDWTGRPIAKEDFNSLAPTPGFTRAKDSSTALSQIVAEAINTLTGGDKYTKGFASPTPDQLDYLAGQVTGGAGRTVINTAAAANAALTSDEIPLYKIPLVGRFLGKTKEPAAISATYYRNVEKMNVLREVFENEKDQDIREKYKKQNPEWIAIPALENAERAIKKLKKYKKMNATVSSDDEEKKRIDDIINETMLKTNEIINDARHGKTGKEPK